MCGIVGYTGSASSAELLVEGLKRLEYRGYDSAGVAVPDTDELQVLRRAGKVAALAEAVSTLKPRGNSGIGHTRWATHGGATESNAHPHLDCTRTVAVVHNGIIENFDTLRHVLESEGHKFSSETDTEVIAHLVERFYTGTTSLEDAVADALTELSGTYGIAVVSLREPEKIVVARRGSPLVIAMGDGENYIASDIHALVRPHSGVVFLKDNELAVVTPNGVSIQDSARASITPEVEKLNIEVLAAERATSRTSC
jgi:glutamine---fructose-6-phosphate transaminase (isomerizing)